MSCRYYNSCCYYYYYHHYDHNYNNNYDDYYYYYYWYCRYYCSCCHLFGITTHSRSCFDGSEKLYGEAPNLHFLSACERCRRWFLQGSWRPHQGIAVLFGLVCGSSRRNLSRGFSLSKAKESATADLKEDLLALA